MMMAVKMRMARRAGWLTLKGAAAALALLPANLNAQAPVLKAGAGRIDVTPPLPAGLDAATGRYEHEHLFARAIVVDNGSTKAALLAVDAPGLDDRIWQEVTSRIAADLHVPPANILLSATHTHSGGLFNRTMAAPGKPLSSDQQFLVDGLVNAARRAQAALRPAVMGYGTGSAWLNVNRDAINPETHRWTQAPNTQAPSDKTVAVLRFQTPEGEPIGVYVNYAMHPVNGYLSNFMSADFPGAMSRYVEQAFGDKSVVIFSQGASGDQNPLHLRSSTNGMASRSQMPITGKVMVREDVEAPLRDGKVPARSMEPAPRERLLRWMESLGTVLGEEVIRVMSEPGRLQSAVRIAGAQEMVTCPGRRRIDKGREGAPGTYEEGVPVNIRLGMLGIGDVALTSVDAEIYTLIGQRAKRQSPMANTVVVTLANGKANSGYIPDDASFGHETFQVLGSSLKPGCAEDAIADGLARMTSAYLKTGN